MTQSNWHKVGKMSVKKLLSINSARFPLLCQGISGYTSVLFLSIQTEESREPDYAKYDIKTFQGMILALQDYWAQKGCTIVQPLDMEVGAGTSHPMTCLRAFGPEPIATAYVQPSRRPTDGRYGENQTVCSTTTSSR